MPRRKKPRQTGFRSRARSRGGGRGGRGALPPRTRGLRVSRNVTYYDDQSRSRSLRSLLEMLLRLKRISRVYPRIISRTDSSRASRARARDSRVLRKETYMDPRFDRIRDDSAPGSGWAWRKAHVTRRRDTSRAFVSLTIPSLSIQGARDFSS